MVSNLDTGWWNEIEMMNKMLMYKELISMKNIVPNNDNGSCGDRLRDSFEATITNIEFSSKAFENRYNGANGTPWVPWPSEYTLDNNVIKVNEKSKQQGTCPMLFELKLFLELKFDYLCVYRTLEISLASLLGV